MSRFLKFTSKPRMFAKKYVVTALLIYCILLPFVYWITQNRLSWIFLVLQAVIIAMLFVLDFSVFCHAFFWFLFGLSIKFIMDWPLNFIVPLLLYAFIILVFKRIKGEISWMRLGSLDKSMLLLLLLIIAVSSLSLVAWVILAKPDLSDLKAMVPFTSILAMIIMGLLFSIFNAIWEEAILKGILWNGLEKMTQNVLVINVTQAVLFGVMHLYGFPRGIIGVLLAGVYGFFLGILRHKSKGMLAPIIAHFFTDLTIFCVMIYIKLNG